VDGAIIPPQPAATSDANGGYAVYYLLTPEILHGKQSVTVKFAAHPGKSIAALTALRALRTQ